MTGEFPLNIVDHENGIKDDNRWCNLRAATYSENNRSSVSRKNTTSKFKGVCWHKSIHRWYVSIRVDGKSKHLGSFEDEVEAARSYNRAAIKYHKEFALLNDLSL